MTSDATKGRKSAAALPDAEQVKQFLRENPDFLIEHPEMLAVLTPPAVPGEDRENGVVDFQRFALERLQGQVASLTDTHGALIATTRSNMSSQSEVHQAALAVLDTTGLEHAVHVVTHEFAPILGLDVVVLGMEWDGPLPSGAAAGGATALPPGTVDTMLGENRKILLRADGAQGEPIFGPAAQLVASDALVRMGPGPSGAPMLLAFGSRDAERFHPGQGTELLCFLAETVNRCLERWLAS